MFQVISDRDEVGPSGKRHRVENKVHIQLCTNLRSMTVPGSSIAMSGSSKAQRKCFHLILREPFCLPTAPSTWARLVSSLSQACEVRVEAFSEHELGKLVDTVQSCSVASSCRVYLHVMGAPWFRFPDRFVEALINATHPLARCLHQLNLSVVVDDVPVQIRPCIDQLAAIAAYNPRLALLRLDVEIYKVDRLRPLFESELDEGKAFLEAYDGARLPMGLAEKLAFLSVLWGNRSSSTSRELTSRLAVLERFDSEVAAIIFQFAVPTRNVRVQYTHRHIKGGRS